MDDILINKKEIIAIKKLIPQERYKYFIKRICDMETVCSIYEDNSFVLNEDEKGNRYLYLFPYKEYVLDYIANDLEFKNCIAKEIDLYKFIDEIVPKLEAKNIHSSFIFPIENGIGLNIKFTELLNDIKIEIDNNY